MNEIVIKHLPSASRSGKNAFYIASCNVVEHSPAYASCLNKLEQIDAKGKNLSSFSDCVSAVRNGRCIASGMRQEEELKGQALYFVARAAAPTGGIPTLSPRAPKPKSASGFRVDGGTYADALNMPSITPSVVARFVAPPMLVGESPIQFARRASAMRLSVSV